MTLRLLAAASAPAVDEIQPADGHVSELLLGQAG